MLTFDVIIIGAGVSGITASIYLKRANKNILLLESGMFGGQINKTSIIENYPGFEKIDGPTLASNMFSQVTNLKINYKLETVRNLSLSGNDFLVETEKEKYLAKKIIVATGRIPKKLGLDNEEKLIGNGISYCAYCDGFFFKGKEVAVVGGGNSALEEALYLSDLCTKVYIIHRRNEFSADEILQDKIKEKSNIIVKYNSVVKEVLENENVLSKIVIKKENSEEILDVSGLFIYIGNIPKNDFLKKLDLKMENNYLIVDKNMKTNINGIYACGDVIKKEAYQISTAVGEGAIAAISVINELKRL